MNVEEAERLAEAADQRVKEAELAWHASLHRKLEAERDEQARIQMYRERSQRLAQERAAKQRRYKERYEKPVWIVLGIIALFVVMWGNAHGDPGNPCDRLFAGHDPRNHACQEAWSSNNGGYQAP